MSLRDSLEQINNFDLNDIDWSRVGVWPLMSRLLLWFCAFAAVLASIYFFHIQTMQATLRQEIANEQQLKSSFQAKAFQAATLDQQRDSVKKMKQDFEFLIAQLPKKTQVPGLLDDIDEKGRLSGLDIVSITLKPEEQGEFYVTLPIEIIVTGSYHSLGAFVSGIAGMSRIVTLHDFSISNDKSLLRMTIGAKTYRSRDDGGA